MTTKYDLAVFIGRFQPFHIGHHQVLSHALSIANRVLILVGSTNGPRTIKNPFSFEERVEMILADFPGLLHDRLVIKPINDFMYDETRWTTQVQSLVEQVALDVPFTAGPTRIAIVGFEKDETSYYLRTFPQWDFVPVNKTDMLVGEQHVGATTIRDMLFTGQFRYTASVLTENTMRLMVDFLKSDHYAQLKREYDFIREYKRKWDNSPYPPTFLTTDAVVVQSGHVLLIRRKMEPGKGLWALPGGFVGPHERLFDSCVRELREETGLKVPEPVLRHSNIAQHVFDNPYRSLRGRTITHAFMFKLDDSKELPKVRGGDDADKAKWVPLSQFWSMSNEMYEDHWSIVNYFLNRQ